MEKDLDIVVYGATGFTGKLCVKYLAQNSNGIKWAIAGRDRTRLSQVAIRFSAQVEKLKADGDDQKAQMKLPKEPK